MGTLSESASHRLFGISFGIFSSDEIKKLSVKEITNPQSFDALMHPTHGGLYDPALGPNDRDDICGTCSLNAVHCPGHMGHIVLPLPVYNPIMFKTLIQVLKGLCFECNHFRTKDHIKVTVIKQLEALSYGQLCAADSMQEILASQGECTIDEFTALLDECLQDSLKNHDTEDSCDAAHVKNVTEKRQAILKNFLNGAYFKSPCPHCHMPARTLRSEHHSKLFFCTGVKKKHAVALILKRRRESMNLSQNVTETTEEVPEHEQVEMEKTPDKNALKADEEKELSKLMQQQTYITPSMARDHLRELWNNDTEILKQVFGELNVHVDDVTVNPMDVFFITILPVAPSRFRPVSVMRDKRFDNPQTANIAKVLTDSHAIREIFAEMKKKSNPGNSQTEIDPMGNEVNVEKTMTELTGKSVHEQLNGAWIRMQTHVNAIVDSNLDKLSTDKNPGIKQLLEKKEGLFRMHMMGKRVNYAARSVISPDPYINTNEIGIPEVFAKKLTYPQPVTPWNFRELKQAVINGPNILPGAWFVENEDGKKVMLHPNNKKQREAIAKQLLTPSAHASPMWPNKRVYRHLKNGDVLLLNRQPTLHRPSIQAHKARILPREKTLRLHYANCKAYNADFDGDEMNAHFPQSELARAEAYTIMGTDFNYLVPKDGTPLAGLIQDHMVSGVNLMIRGRYFTRADYQQLIYGALTDCKGRIKLLPPTILKPRVMWSGKQVISTLLLNIAPEGAAPLNLMGKAKVALKNWCQKPSRPWIAGGAPLVGDDMSESQVVIQRGELLVGVLDKGHYGNTPYGLVHSCYELYGGPVAGKLLTSLARLFTIFLQWRGFTLGVEDILCTPKANAKRKKIMIEGTKTGTSVAAKAFGMAQVRDTRLVLNKYQAAHFSKDGAELKDLDLSMKGNTDEIMNNIVKAVMPIGLLKLFPANNLQLMVQSGAKGSMVNCMQISCLLGQIELEGRRPPLMMSGQSLPSFLAYDTSPRAGGFVDGRFLTGIRPQEYFFHCMAGREGLVDTAVKTSRSGYLQRCIIKHMEGLVAGYDATIRDSDGSIVQFSYGEDGLDVMKTPFLKEKQFPFLIKNKEAILSEKKVEEVSSRVNTKKAPEAWKKLSSWKKKNPWFEKGEKRLIPFQRFCHKKWTSVIKDYSNTKISKTGRSEAANAIIKKWQGLSQDKQQKYYKHTYRCPDPVVANHRSDRYFGAVTENFENTLNTYVSKNPDKLIVDSEEKEGPGSISSDRFKTLMRLMYMQSLVPPGEGVGLLAAQSIGEPSTQMTLNTFHFAGRGEMNVTLGIPRLREILMVASANIKTPTMVFPLLFTGQEEERGTELKRTLNKVLLSNVLEDVEVTEKICVHSRDEKSRQYTVRFNFLPHSMYKTEYCVTPAQILQFMEKKFIAALQDKIKRTMLEMENTTLLTVGKVKPVGEKKKKDDEEDEDIDDDELHDGDATAARARERQGERAYDGEEEERELMGETADASDGEEADPTLDEQIVGDDVEDLVDEEDTGMITLPGIPTPPASGRRKSKTPGKTSQNAKMRANAVLGKVRQACKYKFDTEEEQWCEVTYKYGLTEKKVDIATLIESEAKKFVVWQMPGITRCVLNKSKKPGEENLWKLTTEGVNIRAIHKYYDILDLNKLFTNDIHAMSKHYGIEAARSVIIKEVRDVFAAYGIQVDYRHLSLVADYMTFEGVYKAFNRIGLESNASPLQKMSFETTMNFLKAATIHGARDTLQSPSSCIVAGRVVKSGTGCFELKQPLC